MGGVLDTLSIGRSGVSAAQRGVALTGHNISNATTKGYHRRELVLAGSVPAPPKGGGVEIQGTRRYSDALLARQLTSSLSGEAHADARNASMVEVEAALVDLEGAGISDAVSALFDSFSALSTTPGDATTRAEVVSATRIVSSRFNVASGALAGSAARADADATTVVAQANGSARSIAQLNVQIETAEARGDDAGDLRDRRHGLLEQLAKDLGARSFAGQGTTVTVLVGSITIVEVGRAFSLQSVPDPATANRHTIERVDGGARTDVTAAIGGRVGGLITQRDQTIPGFTAKLDTLAHDIVRAINTQHSAGFGLDGLSGRDLFAPAGATSTGAAAAMAARTGLTNDQIAASSSAGGVPGNNVNALALVDLRSAKATGGGTATFTDGLATLTADVGREARDAKDTAALRLDERTALVRRYEDTVGVSLDEEMIQLIRFQRSFQASARVISTVDDMLGRIMEL